MRKRLLAQSVIEYFVITGIVLALIISTGFLGRVRGAFDYYFDRAAERMR